MYADGYIDIVQETIHRAWYEQKEQIMKASQAIREALMNHSGVFIFGCSHAGLAAGDVLIIHSVSGRNNVPVEMALEARAKGITTIAITNVAYSSSVSSRHPSKKRLFEVCDILIDNKGEVGDAAVSLKGLPERIGPTSTACGTALLNGVVIETVGQMLALGEVPPVFVSANLDGGDEHNKAIFEKYKDQIHYN